MRAQWRAILSDHKREKVMEKYMAKLPIHDTRNARHMPSGKDQVNEARRVVPMPNSQNPRDPRTIVRAIWWMGRSRNAETVHCSVWVRDGGREFTGYGTAGGGGYHKGSAALQAALDSAGITLSSRIDGAGDYAMGAALDAVAEAVAPGQPWIRG
jgi:hypothetical protein